MATTSTTVGAPYGEEQYAHLERRPRSWRKQLFLKRRNIAVGQLVYNMRADGLTPAEAAREYGLPVEQVHEALAYYQSHRALIEQEAEDERKYLEARGLVIDPPAVP